MTYPLKGFINLLLGNSMVREVKKPMLAKCLIDLACNFYAILIRTAKEGVKVDCRDFEGGIHILHLQETGNAKGTLAAD